MAKGHDSIFDQSRAPLLYRLTAVGILSMGVRERGLNVPVELAVVVGDYRRSRGGGLPQHDGAWGI